VTAPAEDAAMPVRGVAALAGNARVPVRGVAASAAGQAIRQKAFHGAGEAG
jgi:hypothetical protein